MGADTTAGFGIALLGLLLGMRHATDPDHVIAVTTILSRERRLTSAARVGIVWGLGHTVTVLMVGAAIIIFKLTVPARIGLAMEFAVALVLILLGAGAAAEAMRQLVSRGGAKPTTHDAPIVHAHRHSHHGHLHTHPHVHLDQHDLIDNSADRSHDSHLLADRGMPLAARRPILRSFAVGLVHGLAGSAAIALLVLSAIPEPIWASLYLAVFCVGTIIGMGLVTTALATPLVMASGRMAWLNRGFATGSGLLSFGFGLVLAYRIGIVEGLFSAMLDWASP